MSPKHPSSDSCFMKACRLEKTEYTPVWLMRQAGRYQKEYRKLRERVSFLELCKNPELVAEITIRAQEFLGADAAIIFADILLPLETLGKKLEYSKSGPVISPKLQDPAELKNISKDELYDKMSYLRDGIRRTRSLLNPKVPLIGFTAAPFTLASYLIEGGPSKDFVRTRKWMTHHADSWAILMTKISEVLSWQVSLEVESGVQAIQGFDSWVGNLTKDEYKACVGMYSKRVLNAAGSDIPVIHFATNSGHLLEDMSEAGGTVLGVDSSVSLGQAWLRTGLGKGIQGNLDSKILLGDQSGINEGVKKILSEAGGRPGHIFNLGHGVLPQTPPENARYLVNLVREESHV